MEITITVKFWRKFLQYLLVGVSAILLLAMSQRSLLGGFQRGPNAVIAEGEDDQSVYGNENQATTDGVDGQTAYDNENQTTRLPSGGTGGETTPVAPAAPIPSCPVVSSQPECLQAADGQYHAFWVIRYANNCKEPEKQGPNELCGSSVSSSAQPGPANRIDQCNPVGSPQGECSDATGNRGHKYCNWQPDGNVIGSCVIEACRYGGTQPNCHSAPANQVTCYFCDNGNWRVAGSYTSCPVGMSTDPNKPPSCVAPGGPGQPLSVSQTVACYLCDNGNWRPVNGGPFTADSCRAAGHSTDPNKPPSCVAPGGPGQQPTISCPAGTIFFEGSCQPTGICRVCDNGNWRPGGNNPMTIVQCSRVSNSVFDQPEKPTWCQASQQPPASCVSDSKICSAPKPSCGSVTQGVDNCGRICISTGAACPPAQGGNITVNPTITNTNTNTNTNTVTVNNPAPVTFGNVGVGTTVYTQAVQYTQLPKTGLPALVWSALAFIPAGFKMRRFSKVKGQLANHPSYIFENRQYKGGVISR